MLSPDTLLQNRYRIIRRIGAGGMGAVYEARHEELGHLVALKETLHTDDESLRRAFKREARVLAGLQHAGLPRVIDYFADGDGLFLVMEYVTGDDLYKLLQIRGQPFSVEEVMRWANQLLNVLEYLHTQTPPVIHRDIKPQNIKLNKHGDVILLDFGLAKGAASEMTSLIASQSVLGFTLTYAPLEQILKADANLVLHLSVLESEKVNRLLQTPTDACSDIYALGATLYHLLTNKQPAQSPTRALAIWSGKADPLLSADKVNSEVPPAIADVLQRAMALESAERPASAAEMRSLLNEATQPARKNIKPIINVPEITLPLPAKQKTAPLLKSDEHSTVVQSQTDGQKQLLTTIAGFQTAPEEKPTQLPEQDGKVVELPQIKLKQAKSALFFKRPFFLALSTILLLLITFTSIYFYINRDQSVKTFWLNKDNGTVSNLAFSPTGEKLAILRDVESSEKFKVLITLYDVANGKELLNINIPPNEILGGSSVAYSPNGKMLAVQKIEGVVLWDAQYGNELHKLPHLNGKKFAFSMDGRMLASTNNELVKLWDINSGNEIRSFRITTVPTFVKFSPDNKILAIGSTEGITKLWNIPSGEEIGTYTNGSKSIVSVAFSLDGKILASSSGNWHDSGKTVIKLWDIDTGTEKSTFNIHDSTYEVTFSPNGKILATCAEGDTKIKLWDTMNGKELQAFSGHSDSVYEITFSPDGKKLESYSGDKTI